MKQEKDTKHSSFQRSEVVTIRVDPKIRFGLELLSRKQYRNLSSVVEWAINEAIKGDQGIEDLDFIWDIEEADRFVKLAILYPNLLAYEEQILWKLLRENGILWKGRYDANNDWTWVCQLDTAIFEQIRKYYESFKKVAAGQASPDALPKWSRKKDLKKDLDDEIPF
jgi:hypothetical protein